MAQLGNRSTSRRAVYILGIIAVPFILSACNSGVTTNQQQTNPPKPTTTSAPAVNAVIGSSGQAFISKYGPLTNQSDISMGDLHFKEYPGVATDALIVETGKYFGVTPGDNAAYSIMVASPPDQQWNPTAAKSACTAFLPADAQSVKSAPTVDPTSNMVSGRDDIYTSATLAQVFPASAFQDANQNTAQAGSLDISYLYTKEGDSSTIDSCQIMLGEQQTKG